MYEYGHSHCLLRVYLACFCLKKKLNEIQTDRHTVYTENIENWPKRMYVLSIQNGSSFTYNLAHPYPRLLLKQGCYYLLLLYSSQFPCFASLYSHLPPDSVFSCMETSIARALRLIMHAVAHFTHHIGIPQTNYWNEQNNSPFLAPKRFQFTVQNT